MATRLVITEFPLRLQWRTNSLTLYSLSPRSCPTTRYARWDSNAETVRSRRFGFDFNRRGLNDDDDNDDDEEEEEEDGFFKRKRKKRRWWSDDFDDAGLIEETIDNIWIFKVFKAYGWFFPVILASWLLSSGPKAFLMALALPLGQSLLAMAFDKLWGGSKGKPKRRRRIRRKQPATAAANAETMPEEEEEEEEMGEPRKGRMGYQSWVVGSEGSGANGGQKGTTFGGWDDLERAKSAQKTSRTRDAGSERTDKEKGKLSQSRGRKSDTPLLLRLLIAVFPFLGSWTRMFW